MVPTTRRHGSPPVPLSIGWPNMNREIRFDTAEDWCWFYEKVTPRLVVAPTGCIEWAGPRFMGYGDVTRSIDVKYRVHRVVYAAVIGPIPDGMEVDHICHNRACANPAHLRLATSQQNHENLRGPMRNNSSGYRGVRRIPSGRWQVRVGHKGGQVEGGVYETAEEANAAAVLLRRQLHTHSTADDDVVILMKPVPKGRTETCGVCGKEITAQNLKRHVAAHAKGTNR